MHLHRPVPNRVTASLSLGLVGALTLVACGGGGGGSGYTAPSATNNQPAPQATSGFADTALVSDKVGVVATTTTIDANLSNPWGVATAPGLPFWIADSNNRHPGRWYWRDSDQCCHRQQRGRNCHSSLCRRRARQPLRPGVQRGWRFPHSDQCGTGVSAVYLRRRRRHHGSLGKR